MLATVLDADEMLLHEQGIQDGSRVSLILALPNSKGSVECGTCSSAFELPPSARAPLRLPCQHRICQADAAALDAVFPCPVCSASTRREALTRDYPSIELLRAQLEQSTRGACCNFSGGRCADGTPATHLCSTCTQFLCVDCHEYHAAGRNSRQHAMQELSSMSGLVAKLCVSPARVSRAQDRAESPVVLDLRQAGVS